MDIWLQILVAGIALAVLLFLTFRWGNPWYDLVRLPAHLWKIGQIKLTGTAPQKLTYGRHKAQYLLYVGPPHDATAPTERPAIFFIHGGGWQFGNPRMFIVHARTLAEAGYPVYLLCHRKIPLFRSTALRQDVENGYRRFLQDIAEKGKPDHPVIVGGMSSGGNLGALLMIDRQRMRNLNLNPDQIIAGFFMAAPLDLDQMWFSPPILLFAGFRQSRAYRQSNPVTFLEPGDTRPVLVVHGWRDGTVEPASSLSFFRKRRAQAPNTTRLLVLPTGIHFDPVDWVIRDGFVRGYLFRWLEEVMPSHLVLSSATGDTNR